MLVKNVRRLLVVNEIRDLIEFIWLVLPPPIDRALVPRGETQPTRQKRSSATGRERNGPEFIRTFEN